MKKPKSKSKQFEPVLIDSRPGMLAVVAGLVRDYLQLAALQVKMELIKNRITRKYQAEVDELNRAIASKEGGLHVWSKRNKDTAEFGEKKSIVLPEATFGFRISPPKVDNLEGTWDHALARLASIEIVMEVPGSEPRVIFSGSDYIRDGKPSIDKDKLLADRDKIPSEVWELAGMRVVQEELFFFTPKSEVLESTTKEAA